MSRLEMTALAGEPLPVQFRHGGEWHPGVLLGWHHAGDGSCRLRVRFVAGGLRRASWMELADVRLAGRSSSGPTPTATRAGLPVPPPRRASDDPDRW